MGMTRAQIDAELRSLGVEPPRDELLPGNNASPLEVPAGENYIQPGEEYYKGPHAITAPAPVKTKAEIDAELRALGYEPPKPEGFMHRAGQGAHGQLEGIGQMMDVLGQKGREAETIPYKSPEMQKIQEQMSLRHKTLPEYGKVIPESLGLSEEYIPGPEDTLGKVIHTGMKMLTPLPLKGAGYSNVGRGFAETGLKGAGKELGKDVTRALGASTAIEATPKIAEEGSIASMLEDFAKGIFGGAVASKAVQKSIGIVSKQKPSTEPSLSSLAASIRTHKPNTEVFSLAEKHELPLPFNIGLNNPDLNDLANNTFKKSRFTSNVYKDTVNKAHQALVDKVKNVIDSTSPHDFEPSEASREFVNIMKSHEEDAQKLAKAMYAEADSLAKKTDAIYPSRTNKAIYNISKDVESDLLESDKAAMQVMGITGKLKEKFNLPEPKKSVVKREFSKALLEKNPELLNEIEEAGIFSEGKKPIEVKRLIKVRQSLNRILDYDPDIKGVKARLYELRDAIDADIDSVANQEFIKRYRAANTFYREGVADRFRGDIARSVLTGEFPKEAFNLMGSIKGVEAVEKMAGTTPQGKEIVDALKKARLKDVFANSLKDEGLALAPFTNLFNRKEKNRELIKKLLSSNKKYQDLSEVSKVAKEFQKSGVDMLQPSATATTSADLAKLGQIGEGAMRFFLGAPAAAVLGHPSIATGLAAAGAGQMALNATKAKSINLISKLAADPKFTNDLRIYATAKSQGKNIYADTIMKRLIKHVEQNQRLITTTAINNRQKEKE